MGWRIVVVGFALAVVLAACGSDDEPAQFGPVIASVDELVGEEVTATRVVSMPCIPSRRDPVGVWIGIGLVDARLESDALTLELRATDARLGSHPSGCNTPETLLAQSVFLFDGEAPLFASQQSLRGDVTTLVFSLDGRSADELDVVILPTFAFLKGNGERETTIFGLIGRYSLT